MAMFKDFTFDGENSKDYGVYISGDAVYDAPERAMDMVQIPGRNGALALDNGYYNNIDVTYPAGCFEDDQADFAAKLSRIRNMLASRHRYCRLEDAYHPDHFRMALYKSGLDVAPVARNRAGRFNITFDAKPQRFLKSGEVVQELDADAPPTTSYGPADIVTFEGEPGDAIVHGQWPLESVQDLHGYDSPWPAGGGANMLNASANTLGYSINATGGIVERSEGNYTELIPVTVGQQYTFSAASVSINYAVRRFHLYDSNGDWVQQLAYTDANYAEGVRYSITGTIPSGCAYARISYEKGDTNAAFMLGSSSTFVPYSNICPITGFTGAEITRNGKNLFENTSASATNRQVTFTVNNDGSVSTSGTAQTGGASVLNMYCSFPNINENVILSGCPSGGSYSSGYSLITTNSHGQLVTGQPSTAADEGNGVTIPAAYVGSIARLQIVVRGGVNANGLTFKPMIRLATESDDTFAPYNSTTYAITWQDEAGTVYGGTLAYLGGDAWRLTKTRGNVDMGSLNWSYSATRVAFDVQISNMTTVAHTLICSAFKYGGQVASASQVSSLPDMAFYKQNGNITIFLKDSAYTDAAIFKTAMTGQTICYELATPQVYDLTTDELELLIGTNNIFSDTGTTTITVQSPYELENTTLYPSKPLIRVYGSGTIQVNDITITVAEHSGYIDIDCDMMDCHRGADSMNQYVSFSGNDFPELQPGINRILLSGPDKVEITPRWWEL